MNGNVPQASVLCRRAEVRIIAVKKIAVALALLLGAAVVLPVIAAGSAEAQSRTAGCRYTSSEVAKGYRC